MGGWREGERGSKEGSREVGREVRRERHHRITRKHTGEVTELHRKIKKA